MGMMSSDNRLKLLEDSKGEYDLSECWSEGGQIQAIGHYKSLREALIAAEEYQLENPTEYGLTFYPFPRKSEMI